jgi:transcription initiation factor TFIIIB Brf1 subunit/transcription initiation factor TFIIB
MAIDYRLRVSEQINRLQKMQRDAGDDGSFADHMSAIERLLSAFGVSANEREAVMAPMRDLLDRRLRHRRDVAAAAYRWDALQRQETADGGADGG